MPNEKLSLTCADYTIEVEVARMQIPGGGDRVLAVASAKVHRPLDNQFDPVSQMRAAIVAACESALLSLWAQAGGDFKRKKFTIPVDVFEKSIMK